MRIAFAGTPEFSVPALEALLASSHQVVGVLTQPDRPKGRGRQIAPSPVKEAALKHGLPVSQPLTLKDEAGRAGLASWQPDVLVVVAYGLILPRAALTLPRLGCLNIHASLLPRWRGAAPIQRAILAGDATSGVTIMLMDVGLDTGPMLLKREISIARADTGGSLHDRLAVVGASAVIEALEGYGNGTLPAVPQPPNGVTYAAKIEKAEALIDWNRSAVEIERQVRAFNPWPVAETRLDGEQLRVFEAVAEDDGVAGVLSPMPAPEHSRGWAGPAGGAGASDAAGGSASGGAGTSDAAGGSASGGAGAGATAAGSAPGGVSTLGTTPMPGSAPGGAATPGVVPGPDLALMPSGTSALAEMTKSRQFNADTPKFSHVPGTILVVRDDAVVVQCGGGRLALKQVQRPGRRAVSAGDFARGGGTSLVGRRLG